MADKYDYEDDAYWERLCADSDVSVLEDVVAVLKNEIADIDTERVIRRAEWDTYAVDKQDPYDYRATLADYSNWKADVFLLHRAIVNRKSQVIDAMEDRIGQDGQSISAQTIISRLTRGILQYEADPDADEKDLFDLLDTTWVIASGKKMNLREMAAEGWKW